MIYGECDMSSNHGEFVIVRIVEDGKMIVYFVQNWIEIKTKSNIPSIMVVDRR
jgi:hypothetical protein